MYTHNTLHVHTQNTPPHAFITHNTHTTRYMHTHKQHTCTHTQTPPHTPHTLIHHTPTDHTRHICTFTTCTRRTHVTCTHETPQTHALPAYTHTLTTYDTPHTRLPHTPHTKCKHITTHTSTTQSHTHIHHTLPHNTHSSHTHPLHTHTFIICTQHPHNMHTHTPTDMEIHTRFKAARLAPRHPTSLSGISGRREWRGLPPERPLPLCPSVPGAEVVLFRWAGWRPVGLGPPTDLPAVCNAILFCAMGSAPGETLLERETGALLGAALHLLPFFTLAAPGLCC